MATYYWVGGNGTWNGSLNTNWSATSGGSGGAGVPSAADDVVFDAGSNVGTDPFTVTVTSGAVCRNFSTGGAGGALDGAMTLAGSATYTVYGSLTFPAANFTHSNTFGPTFVATTTGNTITTNGVAVANVIFNGPGGEWTLGSALTLNVGPFPTLYFAKGSLVTSGYNITARRFLFDADTEVKALNLGSSVITLNGDNAINNGSVWYLPSPNTTSNVTLTPGTSNIVITGQNIHADFGNSFTYYDISFLPASAAFGGSERRINGTNITLNAFRLGNFTNFVTINPKITGVNFTLDARTEDLASRIVLTNDLIFSGAISIGSGATAPTKRAFIYSSALGTQRTISAGSVTALVNVDFRDIAAAGASGTWTGTSVGNCFGNSNITFSAAKTVYWNLAGAQNWHATAWATTNNGVPSAANFPLPQDTATFTEAGAAGTVTVTGAHNLPAIQMADGVSNRVTAMTLATGSGATPFNLGVYGSVTLFSGLTLTGTGSLTFAVRSVAQNITSAGKTWPQPIIVDAPEGTVAFQDAFAHDTSRTFTFLSGTLQFKDGVTGTVGTFVANSSTVKYLQSTSAGISATLSQATGTVSVQNVQIRDITATGGARWDALNGALNYGNNAGWYFAHQQRGLLPSLPVV